MWERLGQLGLSRAAHAIVGSVRWSLARWMPSNGGLREQVLGHVMYLNPKDYGLSRELLMYGVHEPITTALLQRELREGMVAVDIGSNIGYYALLEARLVGDSGRVLAIEPFSTSAAYLERNIAANGYRNVTVYRCAMGGENKAGNLYLYEAANFNSMTPHPTMIGQEEVDIWRLDDLLHDQTRIDFLRMDIEGYECEALSGMTGILAKFRPLLCIEVHPNVVEGDRLVGFLEQLKGFGYEAKYVMPRYRDKVGRGSLADVQQISIDAMIRHRPDGPFMGFFAAR